MLTVVALTFNNLVPILIAVLLPIVGVVFLIWLIMKLMKENTRIIGKILKWTVLIFALVIALWGFLNILSTAISG